MSTTIYYIDIQKSLRYIEILVNLLTNINHQFICASRDNTTTYRVIYVNYTLLYSTKLPRSSFCMRNVYIVWWVVYVWKRDL